MFSTQPKIFCSVITVFAVLAVCACEKCEEKSVKTEYSEYAADISCLLNGFSAFGKKVKNCVELLDKEKNVIGYLRVAPNKKYERKEGFNSYINTALVFDKKGRILGAVIGKHEETPRFIQKIRNAGFMKSWNGKTAEQAKKNAS